ncbi:ferredoxin reductase domain-containing protein [Saccharicrinis fermentans]|uniref:Na(+)-translocating NADH-quinone reductase subunit F n=1 Tax=Saccharicrinis fermentans DSM 9555 = JCM 21142 TaxID=869213 RepID=W7YR00_9BACT|nr:hypothetical protein [Saccharicrinis fermentans]GAF04854.1 Na(+)-translocating NADH-quinone reductase subunit F [Saccharicrinis fermentans DSM 9555 = JCM 21142]
MLTTIVKKISTKIELTTIEKEAPETYTFKFKVPDKIKWEPGAYAHFLNNDLSNGQKVSKKEVREFSIMTHPDEKTLGFTTRIRQDASNFKSGLLKLKPGDKIRMFKMGNHLKSKHSPNHRVFISMGVGIATFRPFILEQQKDTASEQLITNINIDRSGEFVYASELNKYANPQLKNIFVTKRDDLYKNIEQCTSHPHNTYYVVGSQTFNEAIGKYLKEQNIPERQIIFDKHS